MKLNHIFSSAYLKSAAVFLVLFAVTSCKKSVDIGPSLVSLTGSNVYTSNGGAQSVIAGLLSVMAGTGGSYTTGGSSLSITLGLSADELANYSTTSVGFSQYYTNNLNSTTNYSWAAFYNQIYICNTAIIGLSDQSTPLTPAVRQQLMGEAKFIRAFLYFYTTNLYGDVPLTITNNYMANNVLARSPKAEIYKQVIKDLKDAEGLLSDNKYINGTGGATTDRVRPNKQTASALLARVYLYTQDWKNAETEATSVINSSIYALETDLSKAFLKGSREAIWQIMPVLSGINNNDADYLILTNIPGGPAIGNAQLPLNTALVNVFEPGDARFTSWVGQYNAAATGNIPAATYYYASKYKNNGNINVSNPVTEYPIVFRLSEQYLIRAEAMAQQGNIGGAQADLNVIRARAKLNPTTASGKDDLLAAIARERQTELFTEWGHRWFDLKRTGKIDAVMNVIAPTKGAVWNTNKQLFPIPNADILADPNLTQNPGY